MIESELTKKAVKKKEKIEKVDGDEVLEGAKDTAGRPTKMTEATVKKLLDAFSYSFTDTEACLYADISKQTLYDYCKKYPEFTDHKEALKKNPNIQAKMNKVKAIQTGNLQESGWWLERKSKEEFSTKEIIEQKSNIKLDTSEMDNRPLDEVLGIIKDLLNKK